MASPYWSSEPYHNFSKQSQFRSGSKYINYFFIYTHLQINNAENFINQMVSVKPTSTFISFVMFGDNSPQEGPELSFFFNCRKLICGEMDQGEPEKFSKRNAAVLVNQRLYTFLSSASHSTKARCGNVITYRRFVYAGHTFVVAVFRKSASMPYFVFRIANQRIPKQIFMREDTVSLATVPTNYILLKVYLGIPATYLPFSTMPAIHLFLQRNWALSNRSLHRGN